MPTLSVFHQFRLQDVLDIVLLSFVAYHLYIWFHRTKALKAILGLLALGIVYSVAQYWGLFLTTWVFQILWQVLIILLIILFQPEIRQVLERVNPLYALGWRKPVGHVPWIESFSRTIFELADQAIGALIVFERNDRLRDIVTDGISIDTDPSREMLLSIFQKNSPLHDGAVLIRNGRISMAASFLPLTPRKGLDREWGTRHRSAIGITEQSDAWVLVVSEETRQVSLVQKGELEPMDSPNMLAGKLKRLLTPASEDITSKFKKFKLLFLNKWRVKLSTLALVSLVWFSFAGQQDVEVKLEVPLVIQGLSSQLELANPEISPVRITARGLRKDIGILSPRNVKINLDLTRVGVGEKDYFLAQQQISLPNGRVEIIRIEPNTVTLELRPKQM
jgi:uncharacterized protein (TIGR00159 family)